MEEKAAYLYMWCSTYCMECPSLSSIWCFNFYEEINKTVVCIIFAWRAYFDSFKKTIGWKTNIKLLPLLPLMFLSHVIVKWN